jgi:hypothetical protein
LGRRGYTEGQNTLLEARWAEGLIVASAKEGHKQIFAKPFLAFGQISPPVNSPSRSCVARARL